MMGMPTGPLGPPIGSASAASRRDSADDGRQQARAPRRVRPRVRAWPPKDNVDRSARAGQLGLQRGGIDVHRARHEHAAGRVEDAHEHGVGASQLGRDAREQRKSTRVVALARGRGRWSSAASCADRRRAPTAA